MKGKILRNNPLFMRDGMFSKTALILVCAWFITLFKYAFQGCVFSIPKIGIYWAIVFTSGDALAITGAASTLYYAIWNTKINIGAPMQNKPSENGAQK